MLLLFLLLLCKFAQIHGTVTSDTALEWPVPGSFWYLDIKERSFGRCQVMTSHEGLVTFITSTDPQYIVTITGLDWRRTDTNHREDIINDHDSDLQDYVFAVFGGYYIRYMHQKADEKQNIMVKGFIKVREEKHESEEENRISKDFVSHMKQDTTTEWHLFVNNEWKKTWNDAKQTIFDSHYQKRLRQEQVHYPFVSMFHSFFF